MSEFQQMFPQGDPNDAYAQYFIGQSYLAPLSSGDANASNVTFERGCRNNWHIHHGAEQLLLCTAGRGWYQADGEDPVAMGPGDTVCVPAEVKHWHGAAKDSWFSHIAIMVPKPDASNEWLEPVDDEQYGALGRSPPDGGTREQASDRAARRAPARGRARGDARVLRRAAGGVRRRDSR